MTSIDWHRSGGQRKGWRKRQNNHLGQIRRSILTQPRAKLREKSDTAQDVTRRDDVGWVITIFIDLERHSIHAVMCFGVVSELREKFCIGEMSGHCCCWEGLLENIVRNWEEGLDSAHPQVCMMGISQAIRDVQDDAPVIPFPSWFAGTDSLKMTVSNWPGMVLPSLFFRLGQTWMLSKIPDIPV